MFSFIYIQEVLDAGYKLRVVKGSAIERWLAEADPDSAMGKLYQGILDDPTLYFEGFTEAQEELKVYGICSNYLP